MVFMVDDWLLDVMVDCNGWMVFSWVRWLRWLINDWMNDWMLFMVGDWLVFTDRMVG